MQESHVYFIFKKTRLVFAFSTIWLSIGRQLFASPLLRAFEDMVLNARFPELIFSY
jgi:hypothetical protein